MHLVELVDVVGNYADSYYILIAFLIITLFTAVLTVTLLLGVKQVKLQKSISKIMCKISLK